MSGITYKQLGDYLDLNINLGLGIVTDGIVTKMLQPYRGDKNPLNNIKQELVKGGIKFDSTEPINKETLKTQIFPIIRSKIQEFTKGLPGSVADSVADSLNKIIDFLISIIEQPITQDNKDSKIKELTDIIDSLIKVVPILKPLVFVSGKISNPIATSTISMFMAMGDATAAMGDATAPAPGSAPGSAPGALGSAPVSGPDESAASAPGALSSSSGTAAVPALGASSSGPADTSGSGSGSGTIFGGASRRSRCPRGSRRNKKTGECVKVAGYTAKKRCPKGTRRSKTTGACEKLESMVKTVAKEALVEVAELKKADTELAAATKKCCSAASAAAALKRQKKTAANKARLAGKIAAAEAREKKASDFEEDRRKDREEILAKIARTRKAMGIRKNEENPVALRRLIEEWETESNVRLFKKYRT